MKTIPEITIKWLLDSDPSIRWQVERDVLSLSEDIWMNTKKHVQSEGFGAKLLSLQDSDGQWDGGAYFPKSFDFDNEPQPWTATTWSLNALREWGVDPSKLSDTVRLLEKNSKWEYENLPYWDGEVDCCINAYTLANGAWLKADVEKLVHWFEAHQLSDGGWNCEWIEGSICSSFHSTLNSLKGLLEYEMYTGKSTREVRKKGEEYLLQRSLFKKKKSGEIVGDWALRFCYPFYWQYNVFNALDYFRKSSIYQMDTKDSRLNEAIEIIRAKQQSDGTWIRQYKIPGKEWFEIDSQVGSPSKWLTLIGLRILRWWDSN